MRSQLLQVSKTEARGERCQDLTIATSPEYRVGKDHF